MIDKKELEEKLGNLRGIDFEMAESAERAAGETYPELSFSKSFQARLAAHALEKPYPEIKNLPLKEYLNVCRVVYNFLFANSAEKTPAAQSEN